jgi:uncharacterized protein (TIGR02996 family)
MSADEDGLVRAILADPHDLLATSAYADWLEERGKPLHAELYRLRDGDFQRKKRLLEKLGEPLFAAFGTYGAANPDWRDGVLQMSADLIAFVSKKFQRASGVLREQHVVRVCVSGKTKDWTKVGDAPALAGLRAFRLGGDFGEGGAAVLAGCEGLAGLFSLTLTHLKAAWLAPFATSAKLPQLIHLDLLGLKAPAASLVPLGSGPLAGRLQHLSLGHARLEGDWLATLLRAGALLEGLTTLSLAHDGLGDADVEALASSPHLRRLRSLDLSENDMTDAGLKALARSPLAGRLRWLGFSLGGEFTDDGHRALAAALSPDCRVKAWFSIQAGERRRMEDLYGGRWGED